MKFGELDASMTSKMKAVARENRMAAIHAENEAIDPPEIKPAPHKSNLGHLPKHLPRVKEITEPESTT